jgi:hypothetical protein
MSNSSSRNNFKATFVRINEHEGIVIKLHNSAEEFNFPQTLTRCDPQLLGNIVCAQPAKLSLIRIF